MKTNTITSQEAKLSHWRIRWTNTKTGATGLTVLPFRGLIQAELEAERLKKQAKRKPLKYTVDLES